MGLYRQKYLRWNCQKCETHRYEFDEFNIEEPTRCNNNNLSISKISLTCFGQTFAHLQERKTEIFTAFGPVVVVGRGSKSGNVALGVRYEGSCLTQSREG